MFKILVACSIWPHPLHGANAAYVVTHQLLTEFARQTGVKVGFLKISAADEPAPTEKETAGLEMLKAAGIEVLEPFRLQAMPRRRLRYALLNPRETDFYPEAAHRKAINRHIASWGADIVFIPWDEQATALLAEAEAIRVAYYGNPDAKARQARAGFERRHGGSFFKYAAERLLCSRLEAVHLKVMARYHAVLDVAKNDAEYYARNGHPDADYIQNLWIDSATDGNWLAQKDALEQESPSMVIGNLGIMNGTANTGGLEILARDVLPLFERRVKGKLDYEMHICGGNAPHPAIAALLKARSDITMRGFVPDVDAELRRAKVFLCLNNGSDYKVGHTRYLHCWSLGTCIVAHSDCRLSMPEIEDGVNALLGSTPEEVAEKLEMALHDRALRRRLAEAGYRTFKEKFVVPVVVGKLMTTLRSLKNRGY